LTKAFRYATIAFVNTNQSQTIFRTDLKKITAIDFKKIYIYIYIYIYIVFARRQRRIGDWERVSDLDIRHQRWSFLTWTAFRKRIYKECLITVEIVFSLANSGLQLLLQAVLQPDRRNFYGQFRRSAPRLGLKRESEGVDSRDRVHVCEWCLSEFFSLLSV